MTYERKILLVFFTHSVYVSELKEFANMRYTNQRYLYVTFERKF